MSTPAAIALLPPPVFVNDADGLDPQLVLNDMIASYELTTGRTLYPAQVEQLEINLYAYREILLRNAIQYAGQQNLLAFASYPTLDYIGQLLDTPRLDASGSLTTLEFFLTSTLSTPFIIAANTAIGTTDGLFVFTTDIALTIPSGNTSGTVLATCTTPGVGGNGYIPGKISIQVSPNVNIASVANTTTSSAGTAVENDPHYAQRIQEAPSQFSVAGPSGAYTFFAKKVSSAIQDASPTTPQPGTVEVFILTGPIVVQPAPSPNPVGIPTTSLLDKIEASLSSFTVRPLTDTVQVNAVTEIDYVVTATVTLFADADPVSVQAASNSAAVQLALTLANQIQRNLVPSQWATVLSVSGVYEAVVTIAANIGGTPIAPEPDGSTLLTGGQWSNCTAINVTFATSTQNENS